MRDGQGNVFTEATIDVVITVEPGTVHDWQWLAGIILDQFVDKRQGPERRIGVLFMPTSLS